MVSPPADGGAVAALFERRVAPILDLADHADDIARACHAMAARFHRGGKLVVFGSGSACPDAQHIAVEFVHPVIVGKPALPAISLASDVATVTALANRAGLGEIFAHQIRFLGEPDDIALGVSNQGHGEDVLRGLACARERGMLTVALLGGSASADVADHVLVARSTDPRVVKEVQVTTYHVLWELVHVFLEHPGVLGPSVAA